jgi:hypothetical protein
MTLFCGGLCLLAAVPAYGQSLRPFDATRPQPTRQYYATYSKAPVSPYVNLGDNSNGVSNYQTFVRPMIDEREALEQQSAAIDDLNRRIHPTAVRYGRRDVGQAGAGNRPAVRFMDYSHYFGTIR